MSTLGELKIAIVHDELTRRGGAEVVLEELLRIFPQADLYALYAGTPRLTLDGHRYHIKTSFLQQFPLWFRRHPRRVLPLLPHAAEQLDLSDYDVVISSSSGFAKGIVTRAHVPHICYCHTPTRYLWENTHDVVSARTWPVRLVSRSLIHYLRLVDFSAAQRVDLFLANSRYTQERISTYYRQPSEVVYPPIDTTFFTPSPWRKHVPLAQRPFLVVGRLTPLKYTDQAILACEKLGVPLIVVGRGPEKQRLQRLAGRQTRFYSSATADELRQLYREARAVLQPGVEDFGMATAEAQACGTPVIAYGRGGVREIVQPGETGLLYPNQRVEALAEALRQFIARDTVWPAERIQHQALRFSRNRFRTALTQHVARVVSAPDSFARIRETAILKS